MKKTKIINFVPMHLMNTEKVHRVHITEDEIVITWRIASNMVYGNGRPVPDKLRREKYVATSDKKIFLASSEDGKMEPARTISEKEVWLNTQEHAKNKDGSTGA